MPAHFRAARLARVPRLGSVRPRAGAAAPDTLERLRMLMPAPSLTRVMSSRHPDPEQAVIEVFRALDPPTLAGILFFCSSAYDLDLIARALAGRSDGLTVIGCTSSGELSPEGMTEGTLTAIGFPSAGFRLDAICFSELDRFDSSMAHARVRALAADAREASRLQWARVEQAALFLVDGLSHREELLTVTLQDALGPVPLVGGSSGDGLAFRETFVFHDGRFQRDAALVAVLSTARRLHAFRIQHYRPGALKMVVTDADPAARIVREINAEPAAAEYARMVGVRVDELQPAVFALHPPMVRAGGEYFVRSVQSANPDGSLTFYCAIDQGIVLTLGEETEPLEDLSSLFAEIRSEIGEPDRIIGFNCVLNALVAEQRQQKPAIGRALAEERVIGFNTYGEQFHALHVNQTFTGLAIGR